MNINLTLIGQLISFALFVWFCMKFVWPPIITALQARQEKIAKGLAAAEEAQVSLEQAQAQSDDLTKDARQKSMAIIAEAEARAKAMVEAAKNDAKTEGKRQLATAKAEIEQESQRAREELRSKLTELVLSGAGQIVGKEVDDRKHAQLIDDLAKQL
ncbi:MAG: F0F1 ATP synthase subunit B [Gammaproteobacteria bacterium]|nr:MAG: F0F1 ATP synthase subunit B [Gammaproteobacteria bacterium]